MRHVQSIKLVERIFILKSVFASQEMSLMRAQKRHFCVGVFAASAAAKITIEIWFQAIN